MTERVVFLLGAGFSVDAASAAGNPVVLGRHVTYPLVSDLIEPCFGVDVVPAGKTIEDMFQAAIEKGEGEPVERLYDLIMEADYYVAQRLGPDGHNPDNVYLRFLSDFPSAPLLTFNYDSLCEILLLAMKQWRPDDGYGVHVEVRAADVGPSATAQRSERPVLHLHGSLCVYPEISCIEEHPGQALDMLRLRSEPLFLFDPDALGHCFFPFERMHPRHSYHHVEERGIAPVPNKAKGLMGEFIMATYREAAKRIALAETMIVIGYSFNPCDAVSYAPLLRAAKDLRVVVVGPDVGAFLPAMRAAYPGVRWSNVSARFSEWVAEGYPGLDRRTVG